MLGLRGCCLGRPTHVATPRSNRMAIGLLKPLPSTYTHTSIYIYTDNIYTRYIYIYRLPWIPPDREFTISVAVRMPHKTRPIRWLGLLILWDWNPLQGVTQPETEVSPFQQIGWACDHGKKAVDVGIRLIVDMGWGERISVGVGNLFITRYLLSEGWCVSNLAEFQVKIYFFWCDMDRNWSVPLSLDPASPSSHVANPWSQGFRSRHDCDSQSACSVGWAFLKLRKLFHQVQGRKMGPHSGRTLGLSVVTVTTFQQCWLCSVFSPSGNISAMGGLTKTLSESSRCFPSCLFDVFVDGVLHLVGIHVHVLFGA